MVSFRFTKADAAVDFAASLYLPSRRTSLAVFATVSEVLTPLPLDIIRITHTSFRVGDRGWRVAFSALLLYYTGNSLGCQAIFRIYFVKGGEKMFKKELLTARKSPISTYKNSGLDKNIKQILGAVNGLPIDVSLELFDWCSRKLLEQKVEFTPDFLQD